MSHKCKWASCHWLRFKDIESSETLDLSTNPAGASSWKIGPDGELGPDGYRLPSNVWCGMAFYDEQSHANAALDKLDEFLPFLPQAIESWHALLLPIAHRGECNHLDRTSPGLLFEIEGEDPGGPLIVMTTAGFNMGPELDVERVIDFRRNVDRVRATIAGTKGNTANQTFTPHRVGDDGVTMSIWSDESAMFEFAYQPGIHRTQLDRYKKEQTADRTSFSRFRALRTSGQWNGNDPVKLAQEMRQTSDTE